MNIKHALILGEGAIGSALKEGLKTQFPEAQIYSTYYSHPSSSSQSYYLDPLSDDSWKKLTNRLSKELDCIISTIGALHTTNISPEKSTNDVTLEGLEFSFRANLFSNALATKFLKPFLPKKSPSVFAALTAKLASLDDNKIGGWYSYRSSKTALNMWLKNFSIELKREGYKTSVLAIHPGTTHSPLSKPFVSKTNLKVWSPEETASHIIDTIESASKKESGLFKNWDGQDLRW